MHSITLGALVAATVGGFVGSLLARSREHKDKGLPLLVKTRKGVVLYRGNAFHAHDLDEAIKRIDGGRVVSVKIRHGASDKEDQETAEAAAP
jgi:hypothetical protein